jgi:hypothetical protein
MRTPHRPSRFVSGAALLVALATACSDSGGPSPADSQALEGAFVPIYRDTTPAVLESRQSALTAAGAAPVTAVTPDFYIALNKKELGQKFFLSAYLTQMAPRGVASGAARSLGTRVVSFKVQNGKLFMFDVADDKVWSDTFRPEVVLEAYPLIEDYAPFQRMRGASDYVLFDPAAGLNRFRLLQDSWLPVEVALSFSQRFRALPDGAAFQQVFSGILRVYGVDEFGSAVLGLPSVTGTLSLALRRYREGDGFAPMPMPPVEHYLPSHPRLVPNQDDAQASVLKWSVRPGKPIVWKIAPLATTLAATPEFAGVDFVGAIKRGIESWNVAFGFRALEARLADPGESFGDDDVNYFILDGHRGYGAAFANLRSNPNSGEVRGASVYMPLVFFVPYLQPPAEPLTPGSSETVRVARPAPAAKPVRFAWGAAVEEALCERPMPNLQQIAATPTPAQPELTTAQKIERLL